MTTIGKPVTITISSGSTNLIEDCYIHNIGDFSATADAIDVTCHGDNNYRKKIAGLVDLGSIDVTILYKDATVAGTLYSALTSGTSLTCVITIPKSGTATSDETLKFSGFISTLSQSQPKEDLLTQTITIMLDGQTAPTWA